MPMLNVKLHHSFQKENSIEEKGEHNAAIF